MSEPGSGPPAPRERGYDLVVYGASGFVGALVAGHLAEHAPPDVRIALAGRSADRVRAARDRLPQRGRDWPVLVADSADATALAELAGATRVLITTVGPYLRYGLPVVQACARAGTSYADLTGEVLFHREAVARCDAVARDSGARIVHSCGYDSIPSDLAVLLLHRRAAADGAGGLTDVRLVASARGGFSGGTIDSMRAQFETLQREPGRRGEAGDPFALSPDRAAEPAGRQPADAPPPARGRDGRWTAPFVMAPYNTRIVRRSNALLDFAYGRDLRYGEVMGLPAGPLGAVAAYGATAGMGALVGGLRSPRLRPLLDRVLPRPGSGPSERTRAAGWFRMDVDAATGTGRRYRATVSGRGDPGYAATAVMLGQAGLCLAADGERLPDRFGSLTPATALGEVLVDRLRAAGHTYRVDPA